MRMGLIFSRASEAVAWLGVEADDSRLEMVAMDLVQEPRPTVPPLRGLVFLFAGMKSKVPTKIMMIHSSKVNRNQDDDALQALFVRPFWSRVWIIEEIAKARNLQLLCGSQMVYWSTFVNGTGHLEGIPDEIKLLRKFRRQEQSHERFNLIAALGRSRCFESSDARDKIYALLGLTCDGSEIVPTQTICSHLRRSTSK